MTQSHVFKEGGKGGQITLFVILGLAMIVIVLLLTLFLSNPSSNGAKGQLTNPGEIDNVQDYISECVGNSVEESLGVILSRGGVREPLEPKIFYKLKDIQYICYTNEKNTLCTNIEPMLISKVEKEIDEYIRADVEACFNQIIESYSAYDVSSSETEFSSDITPSKIKLKITKELEINSGQSRLYYNDFDFEIPSQLYTLLRIAQKIVNEEVDCNCGAEACNADLAILMRDNYGFSIEKDLTNDGSEVFNIEEDRTGTKFVFAIKNCFKK